MTERLKYILSAEGIGKFKRDMKGAESSVKSAGTMITGAFKTIGATAVAYIGVQAVKEIGRAVFSLGQLAEETRVTRTSFDRLAKGIGQSSDEMLRALRRGTNGAVKDLDLMREANKAILLGIPVTAEKMEELSRVSVRLGRAMGRTATESLGDLVTGIGRMSPLILDNLGITIKAEEAFRGLGEGATDSEKRLAFFNAVMKKANERGEELGDIAPSLQERWDKVNTSFANFGATIGTLVVPALEKLAILMDKIVPKEGQASVADQALGGKTIDALRAKSAGLRARGKTQEADMVDMQIRNVQNQQAQALVDRGDPQNKRTTNRAHTQASGILMALEGEDLGALPPKAMSIPEPQTQIKPLKTTPTYNAETGEMNDLPIYLEETNEKSKKLLDDLGEHADGVFETVAENFNRSMQQSSARIEFGLNQLGIKTNGLFGNLSHGATGLRTLMPNNKDATGLQTTLDAGLGRIANTMMPLGQVAMGLQGLKSAFSFIQGLNSKPDLTQFSDDELEKRVADLESAGRAMGRAGNILEINRAKEEIANRDALKGGTSSGSQSFQSVSRITESQADQMAGILNSILVTNQSMDNKLGSLVQSSRNIEFFAGNGSISQLTEFQGI